MGSFIANLILASVRMASPLIFLSLAELYSQRAGLVICNDSGTSHIAAAAQSRQLTLFGVTRPGRTAPWSPNASWIGDEGAWPDLDTVAQRASELLREATHGQA